MDEGMNYSCKEGQVTVLEARRNDNRGRRSLIVKNVQDSSYYRQLLCPEIVRYEFRVAGTRNSGSAEYITVYYTAH